MKSLLKFILRINLLFLFLAVSLASNASVLLYEKAEVNYYYSDALNALSKTVVTASTLADFESKINDGTAWEIVVFSEYDDNLSLSTVTAIQTWVNTGGKLIFSHYDVDRFSTNALFTTSMGFNWVSTFYVPNSFTPNSTSHRIFTNPNVVTVFDYSEDQYADDGQFVTLTSGTSLATFNGTSNPAIILSQNGRILFNAFQACNFTNNIDFDTKDDIQELIENQILFLIISQIPAIPVANFSTKANVEIGESTTFYDLSTGVPTSWSWSFPGGTPSTSTAQNPVVTYSTAGTYAVTLIATNGLGSDVETKTGYITVSNTYTMHAGTNSITTCGVTLYDNGGATGNYSNNTSSTLTINPSTVGIKVRLTFNSFSTESGYDYLYVYDGTTTSATLLGTYSGSTIPSVITATNASGALTLQFTSDNSDVAAGYSITTSCYSATPTIPVANFNASTTTPSAGQSVSFTDATAGIPTSWSWSFPGGTPSTSTAQNPTVTYSTAGTYAVTLTATNGLGSDVETKTGYITVTNSYNLQDGTNTLTSCGITIYDNGGSTGNYTTNFESYLTINPSTIGSKVRLTFNSFSTESGYDELYVYDGNSTSATLIGTYSGSAIPSVITATNASGALTIQFITDGSEVYDGFSITTSCYSTTPTIPVANFNASTTTPSIGQSVSFTDATTGIPSSWSWSFPGGTPSTSTLQNPSVTYATAGTYAVTLTATNGVGSDGETKTGYITVTNSYNLQDGANTITSCGITIYDNGGATGAYANNLSSKLTIYPVTAGDKVRLTFNSFSTESSIDKLYVYDGISTSVSSLGSYSGNTLPPILTSTDPTGALTIQFITDGSVVSTGFSITTSCYTPPPAVPVTDFTVSSTQVVTGSSVTFNDATTGTPTSWSWSFQGGTPSTSSVQNPVITYSTPGTYNVTLTASNGEGSDVETKTGYITVSNNFTMTSGTYSLTGCGFNIYDNGGPTGNYANGINSTLTILPSSAGQAVRLAFSSFETEYIDYLYVYNGTSTSAPLLGTYSGSSLPPTITATNASGALTIKYTSDGSVVSSGFAITTSCVAKPNYAINTISWETSIDNDDDSYYQSRVLEYTAENYTTSSVTLYAKMYYKLSTASSYTLLGRATNFTVASESISTTQLYTVTNIPQGVYDIKIELYNSSNTLVDVYDISDNASGLGSIQFELPSTDIYCSGDLGGGSFNISEVSIIGTSLSNVANRPGLITNGSYYTYFPISSGYTCTLQKGSTYQIQVGTSVATAISMWIDYNQNGTFESSEFVEVSTSATSATVNFDIPTTAINGKTVMRIRTANSASLILSTGACSITASGCIEDYEISIGVTTPIITFNGKVITSSALSGNQWYNQSGAITGATGNKYTPTSNGNYYVIVTTTAGTSSASNIISVVAVDITTTQVSQVVLYPVPFTNSLTITTGDILDDVFYEMIDVQGRVILKDSFVGYTTIDAANIPSGTYIVKLQIGSQNIQKTVIKK